MSCVYWTNTFAISRLASATSRKWNFFGFLSALGLLDLGWVLGLTVPPRLLIAPLRPTRVLPRTHAEFIKLLVFQFLLDGAATDEVRDSLIFLFHFCYHFIVGRLRLVLHGFRCRERRRVVKCVLCPPRPRLRMIEARLRPG